jgi:hypothetical protein
LGQQGNREIFGWGCGSYVWKSRFPISDADFPLRDFAFLVAIRDSAFGKSSSGLGIATLPLRESPSAAGIRGSGNGETPSGTGFFSSDVRECRNQRSIRDFAV